MQFDHLMHWVPDLDAAIRAYQGLGFSIQPGGEHPSVGTRNAAWRIDARYVELITVHDQGVARAGFGPAWPAIQATLRAGGGGLAFASWSPTSRPRWRSFGHGGSASPTRRPAPCGNPTAPP